MAANDPVETETPVFTEEEIYMVTGFLAGRFGLDEDAVLAATEEAIPRVLSWDES